MADLSVTRARHVVTIVGQGFLLVIAVMSVHCLGQSADEHKNKEVPAQPESSFDFSDVDADGNGCVQGPEEMQKFRLHVGKILGDAMHLGEIEKALRAGRITHSADVNGDGKICECDLLSILLTESTGPGKHLHAFRVNEDGSIFDDVDADGDGFLGDVTEKEALTQKFAQCVTADKASAIVDAMSKLEKDDGKLSRNEYLLFLKSSDPLQLEAQLLAVSPPQQPSQQPPQQQQQQEAQQTAEDIQADPRSQPSPEAGKTAVELTSLHQPRSLEQSDAENDANKDTQEEDDLPQTAALPSDAAELPPVPVQQLPARPQQIHPASSKRGQPFERLNIPANLPGNQPEIQPGNQPLQSFHVPIQSGQPFQLLNPASRFVLPNGPQVPALHPGQRRLMPVNMAGRRQQRGNGLNQQQVQQRAVPVFRYLNTRGGSQQTVQRQLLKRLHLPAVYAPLPLPSQGRPGHVAAAAAARGPGRDAWLPMLLHGAPLPHAQQPEAQASPRISAAAEEETEVSETQPSSGKSAEDSQEIQQDEDEVDLVQAESDEGAEKLANEADQHSPETKADDNNDDDDTNAPAAKE